VLDCYESNGFRIDGIEIKISTSDLRRELEDPEKHVAFFDVIDYYTLACPSDVVEPVMEIIPKKWGILIVNEGGTSRLKRRPLALRDEKADHPVPRGFLASIVRSLQQRTPQKEELVREYERGFEDGKTRAERNAEYMSERVKRDVYKLEAYDELCKRFQLWGQAGNLDETLSQFEAYRKCKPSYIKAMLDDAINELAGIKETLGLGKKSDTSGARAIG